MRTNSQDKILSTIINQFNGLKKVEAFDLVSKLERLLAHAPNPIHISDIETHNLANYEETTHHIDPFQFTLLPNGNFGELLGSNDIMQVYKEHKKALPSWNIFNSYYFSSKYYPLEFNKLTKTNVLSHLKGTKEEERFKTFLKKHSVNKRNTINGKLMILDS